MSTIKYPVDYEDAIVMVVRELPAERAAQLYDFARFLLEKSQATDQSAMIDDMDDEISDEDLAAEDVLWEATMTHHADRFATLKSQAKVDVKAGKTFPMFDEKGEFAAWSFDAND